MGKRVREGMAAPPAEGVGANRAPKPVIRRKHNPRRRHRKPAALRKCKNVYRNISTGDRLPSENEVAFWGEGGCAALVRGGCGCVVGIACRCLGDSLYLTTTEKIGVNSPYTLIAPYVTGVDTQLSVSIAKTAAPSGSTSSPGSDSKAASPLIAHAGNWAQDKDGNWLIPYSVIATSKLCCIRRRLGANSSRYWGHPDQYNGTKIVTDVTANAVTVSMGKTKPDVLPTGATITGTTCPPGATATSVTVTV